MCFTVFNLQIYLKPVLTMAYLLVLDVTTSSVYISPNPEVYVTDGLEEEDIDFQSDISSIRGKVGFYTKWEKYLTNSDIRRFNSVTARGGTLQFVMCDFLLKKLYL